MKTLIKALFVFNVIVICGISYSFAYPVEPPSLTRLVEKSDLIVKGLVLSVQDGKKIPKNKNRLNVELIEKIYSFQVTSSLKGDIRKNTIINIVVPDINWKKVHGIIGGPFWCYMKQGEICMVGLEFYDTTRKNFFRMAGEDLYSNSGNMKYPVVAADLYKDAPEGTSYDRVVWEFCKNFEKGTVSEALIANDHLYMLGILSGNSEDNKKIHDNLIELYKESKEPKRGVLAIALYNSGDTTGLPDIARIIESKDTVAYGAALQCLGNLSMPTTNPEVLKLLISGLSSKDRNIRESCIIEIANNYKSPEAVDAIVKMSEEPQFNILHDVAYAMERMREQITPAQRKKILENCLHVIQKGDNGARNGAMAILRWVGDKSMIPELARFLDADPSKEKGGPGNANGFVRYAAIETMAKLGGKEVIPIIIKGLQFPDWNTRGAAVMKINELTGQNFGYDLLHKASEEEQNKAIQRYIHWWETEGKKQYSN